jgi:hypothetical protein
MPSFSVRLIARSAVRRIMPESTIFVIHLRRSDNKNTNYGALYLQIIGSYAAAPCLSTWNANNVQPHYRRATAIAIGFIATNSGGIVSTWLFTDPPRFQKASRINLAFSLGMAASSVGFSYTSGLATQRSRGRYSGYCRCTGMALEWVGGTHPQSVSDSETAIHASSSQCRPIAVRGMKFRLNIDSEEHKIR